MGRAIGPRMMASTAMDHLALHPLSLKDRWFAETHISEARCGAPGLRHSLTLQTSDACLPSCSDLVEAVPEGAELAVPVHQDSGDG